MLGTVLVTELQREFRPIFSMQPVIRRKNRKAPHKTMITLIHMRSLQTGEKQHLYFERLHCLFVFFFTPFNPSYHTSFMSHLLLLVFCPMKVTAFAFFVLLAVGPIDKDRCGPATVTLSCPHRCRMRTASRATARNTPLPR